MEVKEGDVIQIVQPNAWVGCLAIVDEVKAWGVQCYVTIPQKGQAYYRVKNGEFEYIGKAVYVAE